MLAPWKKSFDKPRQHIEKQRHHLANKGPYHLSYGFSSSHVLDDKKAECQRTCAFKLQYWRRLLRVPWTAWSSNQSILMEINSEYSLEGLMLKLRLQYFGEELTHCDPMDCSTPGFPVHHHLLQFAQTHFSWVCDAIQPSHPLLPSSPLLSGVDLKRSQFNSEGGI